MAIDTIKRMCPVCDKCGYKLEVVYPVTAAGYKRMYQDLSAIGWKVRDFWNQEKKTVLYCPKCRR